MSYTTLQVPGTQYALPMFPNNAIVSYPDDYNTTNKLYPTIIFFHGRGEAGKDLNTFINGWFLHRITVDKWIPQATNPITGQVEKFIVIAIQDAGGWSPYPSNARFGYNYIMDTLKLRVDPKRIFTTGLSSGGQTSLMYTDWDQSYVGKVAGVVSCSPAAMDAIAVTNLPLIVNTTKVWFISGDQDGFTDNAKKYTNILNSAGGNALVTTYSGGHGGWDKIYDGTIKRDLNGKQVNIYEWMLGITEASTPPVVVPPVDPHIKKLLVTIKVYDNGDIEQIKS